MADLILPGSTRTSTCRMRSPVGGRPVRPKRRAAVNREPAAFSTGRRPCQARVSDLLDSAFPLILSRRKCRTAFSLFTFTFRAGLGLAAVGRTALILFSIPDSLVEEFSSCPELDSVYSNCSVIPAYSFFPSFFFFFYISFSYSATY